MLPTWGKEEGKHLDWKGTGSGVEVVGITANGFFAPPESSPPVPPGFTSCPILAFCSSLLPRPRVRSYNLFVCPAVLPSPSRGIVFAAPPHRSQHSSRLRNSSTHKQKFATLSLPELKPSLYLVLLLWGIPIRPPHQYAILRRFHRLTVFYSLELIKP